MKKTIARWAAGVDPTKAGPEKTVEATSAAEVEIGMQYLTDDAEDGVTILVIDETGAVLERWKYESPKLSRLQ